jgi:hypothetical protein
MNKSVVLGVAWMERSGIQARIASGFPDFTPFHPGYEISTIEREETMIRRHMLLVLVIVAVLFVPTVVEQQIDGPTAGRLHGVAQQIDERKRMQILHRTVGTMNAARPFNWARRRRPV